MSIRQQEDWNEFYKKSLDSDFYTEWLIPYNRYFERFPKETVLDLGCGLGRDANYIYSKGYKVVAYDYSTEALERVKSSYPHLETKYLDLNEPLNIPHQSSGIIIMNLSLHYYSWKKSEEIRDQLYNILKPGGVLILRLNSDKDINHDAGKGELIEEGFYLNSGRYKRFFNREMIKRLFPAPWCIHKIEEMEILRYKGKVIYEVLLEKPY